MDEIVVPRATKLPIMGVGILPEFAGRSCYRLQRRPGIWRRVAKRTGTGLSCADGHIVGATESQRLVEFVPWDEINAVMEGLLGDEFET